MARRHSEHGEPTLDPAIMLELLSAGDTSIKVVCVIDEASANARCADRPVVADLKSTQALAVERLDAVMITDVRVPQVTYEAMCEAVEKNGLPPHSVIAPAVLRITGRARAG